MTDSTSTTTPSGPTDVLHNIAELKFMVRAGWWNWKLFGEVATQTHGELIIFNYTNAAEFANRWNWFERVSRGLIMNRITGEVVARPFDKFFNLDLNQPNPNRLVEITNKMDGSLGILYRYNGEYRIATRGSFTSDQATWATAYLNEHHDLTGLDDDLTLLFEIIYPENRIVVDYKGASGLTLIGARDRRTGRDLFHQEFSEIAEQFKLPVTPSYEWLNLAQLLALAETMDANTEGWVIRHADGQRYKIKTNAYRLMHKMLDQLSFKRVAEAMAADHYDHLVSLVPEFFMPQVQAWHDDIQHQVNELEDEILSVWRTAPRVSNKTDRAERARFAEYVSFCAQHLGVYLFALMNDRPIRPMIYRNLFDVSVEKVGKAA